MPGSPTAVEVPVAKLRGAHRRADGPQQAERAYVQLRQLLALQRLRPGQALREVAWCRRLGVGRAGLREALARLEAEGLLIKLARRGYRVPELSSLDAQEAAETRLVLEEGAIERLCQTGFGASEALGRLRAAAREVELLVEQGYQLAVFEADWRFHRQLVEAAGNSRLFALYERSIAPLQAPGLAGEGLDALDLIEDHRRLLKALGDGDAVASRMVLKQHLSGERRRTANSRTA